MLFKTFDDWWGFWFGLLGTAVFPYSFWGRQGLRVGAGRWEIGRQEGSGKENSMTASRNRTLHTQFGMAAPPTQRQIYTLSSNDDQDVPRFYTDDVGYTV